MLTANQNTTETMAQENLNDEPKSFEEQLAEVSENATWAQARPFALLLSVMEEWEQEAKEAMQNNMASEQAWNFQMRWAQREGLVKAVKLFRETMIRERENLIEQMRQELQNQ